MCVQEGEIICTACGTKLDYAFSNSIEGKWYCDWCVVTKDKAELAEYIALKKARKLARGPSNTVGVHHDGDTFGRPNDV